MNQIIKSLISLLSLIAIIVIGLIVYSTISNVGKQGQANFSNSVPRIELVKLSELVTLRVTIARVLSGEDNWYKGAWIVEGDALIGSDLRKSVVENNEELKEVNITLHDPRVIIARVNHDRTKTYDVKSISWNPAQLILGDKDKLRDKAMKEAQDAIETEASNSEYITKAKDQTELVLRTLYSQLGWKLNLTWKKAED
jgi:hypothetical protein